MGGHVENEIEAFRATVYAVAQTNPRVLPWRESADPYRILVSEIMLQQTQADRVAAKFVEFVGRFPDVAVLASSELADVLPVWQGLGYNRRALALKRAAGAIVTRFGGIVPATRKELESLPGIGPYTAGAIMAFAYDRPAVFIETNIRSVFILKREHANPSRKSMHHLRQSAFEGSNRQLRSTLLKAVLAHPGISADDAASRAMGDHEKIARNLTRMVKEGLIVRKRGKYFVA